MTTTPIGPVGGAEFVAPKPSGTNGVDGTTFGGLLRQAIDNVEAKTETANVAVAGMVNNTVDVHQAMLALHEAEESLELTVAIRNKFIQAYQDVMRMPL